MNQKISLLLKEGKHFILLFIPNFMTLGCAPLAVLYNHKAGPASPEEDAPPLLLEAVDSRGATNKEAIFWTFHHLYILLCYIIL